MQRAADLGAKIISMSLGGDDTSDPNSSEFRVVRQLTEQGIICCIAGGNSGSEAQTIGSPGSAPDALTIGAIGKSAIADFSSRGPTKLGLTKPDCTAPGVDILSGSTGIIAAYRFLDGLGRFAAISGTSMATPHASGVLALAEELARRRGGTLTTAAVKQALARHYNRGPDNTVGYGLISYPILKQFIIETF
jgi:subtilisin family serine protease